MKYLHNITFLQYFYSAGLHQSMTKAAKSNFVTQSAISQGIHKLEMAFNRKLISHRKNRFELTPDGELLLARCESVFAELEDLQDLFHEKEGVYKGKFSYATSHSFAISLMPPYYKQLFQRYPAVEPILRLGHSGIVRGLVLSGEVEFGIILKREKDQNAFKIHEILQGEYGIYKAKMHKMTQRDKLIISEDSHDDKKIIEQLVHKLPILEVMSWEVIANMILEGLGIGILPDYVAKKHNLVRAPIAIPAISYSIAAISSIRKPLSRNAQLFINLMQNGGA